MNQNKIFDILSRPEDTESAVRSAILKNCVKSAAKTAYCGEAPDFPLCKKMPVTRLSAVILLLCEKYDEYAAMGVPEKVIAETFRDVTLRANLYKEKTGKTGISKDDVIWFRHIMNLKIFKIGSIQFQPFNMLYLDDEFLGEPYMTFSSEQKTKLPAGASVINCHIQYGADLSAKAVKSSFDDASVLFQKLFPNEKFKAFICYSWLLFPDMVNHLPKNSKIKAFAKNFKIIGRVQDNEQAFEYLFKKACKRPSKRLCKTFLQALAAENPKLFGFACGIICL